MRRIRLLFIALALVGFASLGGGVVEAAAQTVLCKANEATCSPENTLKLNTPLVFHLKPETMTTMPYAERPCFKSTLEFVGVEHNLLGELVGRIENLEFSECLCPFWATGLPYEARLWAPSESEGTGNLRMIGGPTIEGGCLGATCSYSASEASVPLEGGNPAAINIEFTLLKKSGVCVETGTWKADYRLVSPEGALFVTN